MKDNNSLIIPPFNNGTISMNDEEYSQLRELIHSYCGIYFDPNAKYLFEKRLTQQLKNNQLYSFKDYLLFLKFDMKRKEEMDTIVDLLTTNETYFFREEYQLRAFSEEIVPDIQQKPEKRKEKILRVWSAGCSTGEEPYTIAIILKEMQLPPDWRVEILASDISQRVLLVARKGVYPKSSFRAMEEATMRKYFDPLPEGKYRIKDEVRSMVNFAHLNLTDSFKVTLLEKMDVIFCRNVLIYFDLQAKKGVLQSFYNRLMDGGYLLLGHAESLMNVTTYFHLKHLKNDLVYQKPVRPRMDGLP